jgi:hypothetical protein
MKLIPLGSNQNLVQLNGGVQVLFSYKTPVAAYVPGQGYFRTNHDWSRTTSKHINKWLRGVIGVSAVDQSVLDNIAGF